MNTNGTGGLQQPAQTATMLLDRFVADKQYVPGLRKVDNGTHWILRQGLALCAGRVAGDETWAGVGKKKRSCVIYHRETLAYI